MECCCMQKSGIIFATDNGNHRIQVFGPNGKFLFKFGLRGSEKGQFQSPRGLAFSNCLQYLFFCDCNNDRIQLFNAMNGLFIKSYGSNNSGDSQFNDLYGICISPSGQIIVSEFGNRGVQIFE
jgi:hypothetical protein